MIRPQDEFPLLEEYKKHFPITRDTIFALGEDIYTNNPLTPDLLVHENVHLEQQAKIGVKEWVYDFIYIPEKRLEYELEAYIKQVASVKDRNRRVKILIESSKNLSSGLYGDIIDYQSAYNKIKNGAKI